MVKVSLSESELSLDKIALHHALVEAALFELFANGTHLILAQYVGHPLEEVRDAARDELDLSSSLSVLSSVEASIRTDYLRRVYQRDRSQFSRSMRNVFSRKGERARLGRYWTPKFGRKYDFSTVYTIASVFIAAMKNCE